MDPPSCFSDKDEHIPKACNLRQKTFLDRAAKVALKSPMTHKHGCVIVCDGEIIAEGYNFYYTHMFHKFSIHAEVDALNKLKRKALSKKSLHDCELYVVRIAQALSFQHCLMYSKPCNDCQKAIRKSGVKRVYYSTSCEYEEKWMSLYGTSSNGSCSSRASSKSG